MPVGFFGPLLCLNLLVLLLQYAPLDRNRLEPVHLGFDSDRHFLTLVLHFLNFALSFLRSFVVLNFAQNFLRFEPRYLVHSGYSDPAVAAAVLSAAHIDFGASGHPDNVLIHTLQH